MSIKFKNLSQVLQYLKKEGWKVGRSKIYEDKHLIIKKNGIEKANIDNYALQNLKKVDKSGVISDKRREETRLLKERADKISHENKVLRGLYIPKSEVSWQLAARAAYLKTSLEEFFHSMTPRLIERCNGDLQYVPDITEFYLTELAELFDHYSKPLTFRVPVNNDKENLQ